MPTTDSAINAANYLVNNLNNLTGNISRNGRAYNTGRTMSSSQTNSINPGSKGRTGRNGNAASVGNLMSHALLNPKHAEE